MNTKLIGTAVIAVLVAVGCGKKEYAKKTVGASNGTLKAESARTECVQSIIENMVGIPGKNFKMGRFEVTQRQWVSVMGDNPSKFKGDDNPVENVSWNDCKQFLVKLNAMPKVRSLGLTFRLPTEAEWEYACSAGSTGYGYYCKLADGTEITDSSFGEVAWYGNNSNSKPHPVGQKKPNAFGLYDMYGNVWEWCEDALPADNLRAIRGGSWTNDCSSCTSSSRERGCFLLDLYHYSLGFRLAATTREEPEPEMTEEEPEPEMTEEEKLAVREETLVMAFDDLTDKWRAPVHSDVPMAEVENFHRQFKKIPDSRKEECLQRALNLLPDENIMLLAGILTDKEQPREYLELVFNDILNRDESVKIPLLELIYKDKEHPCWETTAWIFDASGSRRREP